MDDLLKLLTQNAQETPEVLAQLLNTTPDDVRARIADYEERGIIRGYRAVIDEDRLPTNRVQAVIELRVRPRREGGFNPIAEQVGRFRQVRSLFLMSGGYDLMLFVEGETLHEVATFVSENLSTLDGVRGTSTHFMLKTYKDHGVLMQTEEQDERLQVTP